MNKNIQIMKMKPEDLPQIQILYTELIPEDCSLLTFQKNYEKMISQADTFPLTAKKGSTVLGTATGFLCTALDASFLVVENVVVKKDCRGMGIGRKLMKALDEIAVQNDCGYSVLVSSGFRKDAHRFYELAGYTDDVRGFRKWY